MKTPFVLLVALMSALSLADLAGARKPASTLALGAGFEQSVLGEKAIGTDAVRGLLVEHCVACHDIPGLSSVERRATLDAPSFRSMAGDPERYPEARLRTSLRQPHWPMRGFILSDHDIERILSFIARLRAQS